MNIYFGSDEKRSIEESKTSILDDHSHRDLEIKPLHSFSRSYLRSPENKKQEEPRNLKTISIVPLKKTEIERKEEVYEFIIKNLTSAYTRTFHEEDKIHLLIEELYIETVKQKFPISELALHLSQEINKVLSLEEGLTDTVLSQIQTAIKSKIAWQIDITEKLKEENLPLHYASQILSVTTNNLSAFETQLAIQKEKESHNFCMEIGIEIFITSLKFLGPQNEHLVKGNVAIIIPFALRFFSQETDLKSAEEKTKLAINICMQSRIILRNEINPPIADIIDTILKIYDRCRRNGLSKAESSTISSQALYSYITQLKQTNCLKRSPENKASNVAFKLILYYKLSKSYRNFFS